MRVLLLSDIHGNLEALEAVLASAPEHDAVANLGDIVGYGANPNEVIERSQAIGKQFVRGNHDKACAGVMDVHGFNYIAAAAVVWTNHALTKENLEWLKALPPGPLSLEGANGTQIVHGSPRDEDEYLLVSESAAEAVQSSKAAITFFGHTHMQGGFHIIEGRETTFRPHYQDKTKAEHWSLHLKPEGSYLINPGSVGQPRDGDWRAGFAVYDSLHQRVVFYRIPYDIETTQKKIIDAGLPERLAQRLSRGR